MSRCGGRRLFPRLSHSECSSLSAASVLRHPRRSLCLPSFIFLRNAQGGSGMAVAGLWGCHKAPPSSSSHAGLPRNAARHDRKDSAIRSKTQSHVPSSDVASRDSTFSNDFSVAFSLDPPFTPVRGEEEVAAHAPCVYACRRCGSSLFQSDALVPGSAVGHHSSGWPSFVAPLSESAVRLRTVLQRSVVAQHCEFPASSTSAPTQEASGLRLHVPDTSMVQRGLAVEGDLVRLRGRQIGMQRSESWRETCLRDENHRADPTLVIGCCGGCGCAVCRVTQSAAEGSRYVSTASCIDVQAQKKNN